MTREAFRELVKKGPVLLDGATGTNLQKAGMPVGVCPEQWILENPEIMIKLQEDYVAGRHGYFVCTDIYREPDQIRGIWTCRPIRGDEPRT